jgi:hypothetical protein
MVWVAVIVKAMVVNLVIWLGYWLRAVALVLIKMLLLRQSEGVEWVVRHAAKAP